jgi:NAD(P)-dependent dehydrogenase (short-subunit alcohol dehydrogenase family)
MSSYLITGCSRGIGLEFVRQLVGTYSDIIVFASARSDENHRFRQLLQQHPERVIYVPLDVTNEDSIKKAVGLVTEKLGGKGLDQSINQSSINQDSINLLEPVHRSD